MKKYILISLAALSLSSCGIYNKYTPAETVNEDLFGNIEIQDSLSIGDLEWKQFFTDPYLQALIEKGLENNVDLQTAQLRVKQADAVLLASKLSFLPGFSLSPQGTISSFDHSSAIKSYTLPVSASWQVDLFGSLLNSNRQNKTSLLQSKAYEQAVKAQLISSIANYYYTLLMLDSQLEISTETKFRWEESVRVAKALKAAGQYTEAGVAQTEATYFDVCNSLEDLKLKINSAENGLSLLLAHTPEKLERGSIENQNFTQDIQVGIPINLLSNRPDVVSAEQTLARSFYGVNKARSAFYPALNLSGNIGWTNNLGQMIVNPGKLIESAVASLTQPIFAKGQNVANLRVAKYQFEENKLAFEQILLKAGSEVNDAFTSLQTAKTKSDIYSNQIVSLENAVRSTKLLMQNGSTNYLEVLTAEKTLLSARINQTANKFSEIQALINLYQALGGGK